MERRKINPKIFIQQTVEKERKKQERRKPVKRERYKDLQEVYPSEVLFKRMHPEAYFRHRRVKDKATGVYVVKPVLDKNGNKIPTVNPTAALWRTINVGDRTIVIPKSEYDKIDDLVGKANAFNRKQYQQYLQEYENLQPTAKATMSLSDYLTSWMGVNSTEEVSMIKDGAVVNQVRYKSFDTQKMIKSSIKASEGRYSTSTAIQKLQQNLRKQASPEFKKARDETFQENFAYFIEQLIQTSSYTPLIKQYDPAAFRVWFDTTVKPSLEQNNLVSKAGSFYMMYDSDTQLNDKDLNRMRYIVSSWFETRIAELFI